MAFPTVVATNTSTTEPNNATHTVSLPDGSDTSGRLLIVLIATDGSTDESISVPTGWTQMWTDELNSSGCNFAGRYIVLDGTEGYPATGATQDFTTASSEESAHISFLIEANTFDSTTPLEFANFEPPEDATEFPDPPSLGPSWGAADTLWIAACGWDDNDSLDAYPTNYSDNQNTIVTGPGGACGIAAATRNNNTSTEDPGQFDLSDVTEWMAATIGIQPTEAAASASDDVLVRFGSMTQTSGSGLVTADFTATGAAAVFGAYYLNYYRTMIADD